MNFNSFCIKNNSFKIRRITPPPTTIQSSFIWALFLYIRLSMLTSIVRHIVKPYIRRFNKDFHDSGINTPPNRFPLNLHGFKQEIRYNLDKLVLTRILRWIDYLYQLSKEIESRGVQTGYKGRYDMGTKVPMSTIVSIQRVAQKQTIGSPCVCQCVCQWSSN